MRLNERNSQRSAEQAMQAQTTKGNNYDGGKNKKGKGSAERVVVLVYCKIENQIVDLFTKPLLVSKFKFLRKKLGLCRS